MDRGHASLADALRAAIASWPGERPVGWWLWHLGQKAVCVLRDYEYMDNANFYYYRRASPWLAALPTFGWIVGLALVGCALLLACGRQRPLLVVPALAGAAVLAGCLLGFALGRYRLPLVLLLAVPAGAAVSLVWQWLAARRWLPAIATLAAAAAISTAAFLVTPAMVISFAPDGTPRYMRGELRGAWERALALREQEPGDAALALHAAGDKAGAARTLDAFVAEYLAFFHAETGSVLARPPVEQTSELLHMHAFLLDVNFDHARKHALAIGDAELAGRIAQAAARAIEPLRGRLPR
jgi:hypothetical protein